MHCTAQHPNLAPVQNGMARMNGILGGGAAISALCQVAPRSRKLSRSKRLKPSHPPDFRAASPSPNPAGRCQAILDPKEFPGCPWVEVGAAHPACWAGRKSTNEKTPLVTPQEEINWKEMPSSPVSDQLHWKSCAAVGGFRPYLIRNGEPADRNE